MNTVAGFISAVDSGGTVIASTYLGESAARSSMSTTHVNNVAFDAMGNLIAIGSTDSQGMQITPDAFTASNEGATSGYVAVLGADLKKLTYGSYIHPGLDAACLASRADLHTFKRYAAITEATGLSVDDAGDIYIGGTTTSPCLDVTSNAVQPSARAENAGFVLRLTAKKSIDYATYVDLGKGIVSSIKVFAEQGSTTRADASVYIVHNAIGATPTLLPTFATAANQLRNPKTANIYLEHLSIAADGSSSSITSATGLGGTYSTAMLGAALAPGATHFAIVGTTKTGDLPTTAGALLPTEQGDSDGLLGIFSVP